MAEAQAETQAEVVPNVTEAELAHQAPLRVIEAEESKPEVKADAQPETETKVEAEGETKPAESQPEFDWEKVKTFKHKFTVKGEGGIDEEIEIPLEEMKSGFM